jgi:hypothetical protein
MGRKISGFATLCYYSRHPQLGNKWHQTPGHRADETWEQPPSLALQYLGRSSTTTKIKTKRVLFDASVAHVAKFNMSKAYSVLYTFYFSLRLPYPLGFSSPHDPCFDRVAMSGERQQQREGVGAKARRATTLTSKYSTKLEYAASAIRIWLCCPDQPSFAHHWARNLTRDRNLSRSGLTAPKSVQKRDPSQSAHIGEFA